MNELLEFDLRDLETLPVLLSKCPRKCLYALINESDKRIQVYKTSNFLYHIVRILNEIDHLNNRNLKDDIGKIRLVILETVFTSTVSMNIKYRNQIDKYRNLGYTFYKDSSIVNYNIKESYRQYKNKMYYMVELVNTRRDSVLLGVFRSASEARLFISTNYGNGIVDIIVSDDELTKSWISNKKSYSI